MMDVHKTYCDNHMMMCVVNCYPKLIHCSISIVVKSLSCVQLLFDPIDCSPPDSSVHGISQARILE